MSCILEAIKDTGVVVMTASVIHACVKHHHPQRWPVGTTDFGDKVTPKQRAEIDDTLQVLEEVGQQQGPPLENPLVYGNYEVSYTSTLDRSPRMMLC